MDRVLILGGDSDFNLGDAAILAALCHHLSSAFPTLEITVTSKTARHSSLPGVTHVVRRSPTGVTALLRAAHHSDLVIVGGGGLFQDDDSRIKVPFWTSLLAILSTANRNIVGHCLGAGPLRHFDSRQWARAACGLLRSVSVRDSFAEEWLSPCTTRPLKIVPDPAFMLPPAEPANAKRLIEASGISPDRPIIGIAIRRWFHALGGFVPHKIKAAARLDSGSGNGQMDEFLDQLGVAVQRLARRLGASVLLLPTYNVAHENDAAVCRRLISRLKGLPTGLLEINEPRMYKAVTGHLHLMIAARMHPLILASSMGTPIVGLAYNGKFDGLFELLGLQQRPIWLNSFKQIAFSEQLESMAIEALAQRELLATRTADLANTVARHTTALLEWRAA